MPAQAADSTVNFRKEETQRNRTQKHNYFRMDQFNLTFRESAAGSGFVRFRIAVSRRTAFDGIADINLFAQMGRLMFEKLEGKPDRQDLQEFQLELQRMFAN